VKIVIDRRIALTVSLVTAGLAPKPVAAPPPVTTRLRRPSVIRSASVPLPPTARVPGPDDGDAARRGSRIAASSAGDFGTGENFLEMPLVGAHRLRILTPTLLELTLITTQPPQGRPQQWDFVTDSGTAHLPEAGTFRVMANGTQQEVRRVGFKRRVLYAPLK
jgi:hypothetical protein